MDVGRGEKSYLCHLTSPGSLHGFPQSAQSNFSPDSIEHGGLTGRGLAYDKAVPVSDSSGQGAQGCATTALDGGNFRVTLGARSTMETLMGKLASLLGTQNAGSELNTSGQSHLSTADGPGPDLAPRLAFFVGDRRGEHSFIFVPIMAGLLE